METEWIPPLEGRPGCAGEKAVQGPARERSSGGGGSSFTFGRKRMAGRGDSRVRVFRFPRSDVGIDVDEFCCDALAMCFEDTALCK
ncbi:hypothetical protein SKAU_G00155120 [Synaphobranchus kaupii]|uniref:Uncharacterized protein n=1 Tax=Synaphobranchus kaupii TaxID=118154 RepID=A0A9Q1FHE2_SYNKA|nr:hypothetical protein SKAU_G00155120 [Synaphobranchus kaupii]